MRFSKHVLALLLAAPLMAQIPTPQINLTGNIGCQGFPCVNTGTLVMASDANRTLTAQETSAFSIKVTSSVSLTGTRNVIFPAGRFPVDVENATTGGQSIHVIGASGTGVTIANGQTVRVWNDGTNFVQVGASSGGTGTVTHTGALTATHVMTGNGTADSKVDTGCTTDGAGGMTCASYAANGPNPAGGTAGGTAYGAGTAGGSPPAGTVVHVGPASVSSAYTLADPGAPPSGTQHEDCTASGANVSCAWASGGSSGFPITIGSTSVAASSTTTALAGLALTTSSINGVTPSTSAGSGNFLNGAGGYSSPGGISVKIKYVSVEGCPQDTDLTAGGGTDATTCINGLFVGASPTNPILVVQDGASLISGNGVQMPAGGGAFLQGSGGGISQVAITNCSLTSNVATFTTETQSPLITIGQNVQLAALSTCSALNGEVVTALSSGLTSTQFKANFTHANISTGAEVATGKTVYGTGFYLADASGDAISNGTVPSAGNCEIPAGTPPSRGAGLGISNLVINGNAPNQTDYCFLVDFDNANNIFVDNVTLYNAAHYGVHMGNVGQVKITRSSFIAAQAYLGAMVTTDGIHMTGPWNDLTIANDYFNTGDDAIALNSAEGYCGPGDRTEITNSTSYSSLRMLRIYNNGAVCGNGLSPLVDTVNISNYSGSAYGNIADLGFAIIGTLNPAITNVTWANSDVKATTTGQHGIEVVNNIGRLSFDDFTTEGFGSCLLCSSVGSQSIALLKLHNVSFVGNSIGGSSFIAPLGAVAGGGTPTVTDAIVDGLGEYNDTGGTISANCPFCVGAVTNLYASNIDMNLFNTFADSSVTNLIGQAGPNSWARNPAGGPWTFNAYGGGAGFDFYPHSSGGSAFNRFYDVAGKTLFCMDTNNEWLKVGGLAAYPTCDGLSDTAEPIFFGSGFINWNRQPGNNGPIFGNVGNWTWFHSPSGTASADCIHMQAQAFGAGGPSDVLVQCADGSVRTKNNTLDDGSGNASIAGSTALTGGISTNVPIGACGGTNCQINFGTNYGALDIAMYDGGAAQRYGWGLTAGTMNFVVPSLANSGGHVKFTDGGDLGAGSSMFTVTRAASSLPSAAVMAFSNSTDASGTLDTGLSRDSAGVVDVGNGTAGDKSGTVNAANYVLPSAGTVKFGSSDVVLSDNGSGTLQVGHTGANSGGGISAFSLSLNQCISNAVPALCGGSTTGTVAVPAGGTTLVVDTTSVTSTGQIQLTFDSSLGAALGVTCNAAINQPTVSARTAGTSFTITMSGSITTNPDCVSYTIIN